MMEKNYEALKLDRQLCFPLYACAREMIRRYTPFLNRIDLTYTQYIAMTVLWEEKSITVKELGERLYLDSGTLTPLLKKLEQKGLVTRMRSKSDERSLIVSISARGEALRDEALSIPEGMASCVCLSEEDAAHLRRILNGLLTDGRK